MSATDLLYFAGGLGDQTGKSDTNGGGGLHSVAGVAQGVAPTLAQMASYMTANGGAKAADTGVTYAWHTPDATHDRLTGTFTGGATNGLVGLVAYIDSVSWAEDPQWAIVTASSATTLDILTLGATFELDNALADLVVNVGGAFATPQAMVSNAADANQANQLVHMFYNVVQDIAATTFNLDNIIKGTIAANAWVIMESYTTVPGDNGRTKWTGAAATRRGVDIDNTVNFIWRNGWLYSATNTGNDGFYVGDTGNTNIIFENCLTDGWADGFMLIITTQSSLCVGCEATGTSGAGFYARGFGDVLYKCIAYGNAVNFNTRETTGRHVLVDCLEYDASGNEGTKGRGVGNYTVCINHTSDGSAGDGIANNTDASTIICINTTVSNSGSENLNEATGSLYTIYTNTYNPGATDVFLAGPGILAVNPLLDNEYKPHEIQVLKGGYNNSVMGAFPAKIVNPIERTRVRYMGVRYGANV
ncbi:MAG: hypothetical protein ABIG61_07240 [Planctomycetota bacterium]